ncbi:7729_t:CDS:2, partial [Entrophospora sp. SA101]
SSSNKYDEERQNKTYSNSYKFSSYDSSSNNNNNRRFETTASSSSSSYNNYPTIVREEKKPDVMELVQQFQALIIQYDDVISSNEELKTKADSTMDQILIGKPVDFEVCREWLESYRPKDNKNKTYSFVSTSTIQKEAPTKPFSINNKDDEVSWLQQPVRISNGNRGNRGNRNSRVSFDDNERSSPDRFTLYYDELQRLEEMGFRNNNDRRLIELLKKHKRKVDQVVEALIN